ncbi:sphingosine 1-phosphate receptor 4-like [Huso huso]|uniref:Sphingosine 1-phosphate receptor 4-like n=1 Tax=Huso huso TaxID=61971 RepID=A0ABR0Y4N8_HUSHU
MENISSCSAMYGMWNSNIILEHYNHTGRLTRRRPQTDGVDGVKLGFIFISCLIIMENLLLLVAIVTHIRFRNWIYICIVNMALSDLLAGIAYIVNLCLSGKRTFQLTPSSWLFREGILFVALAASIFSLLLTAMERYTTMMTPVSYKSARKRYRVYVLIALSWVMAFGIGLMPLLGWNCLCNMQDCSTLLPLYSKNYILFNVIMFSVILAGIWFLYISIYRHVQHSTERVVSSSRSRNKSLRLLKTVILIVGAFIICWSPLFVLLLLDFFCKPNSAKLYSMDWPIALAVLNSAINPIIYSLGSMEVRKAIISVLCCFCLKTGLVDPSSLLSIETVVSSESSLKVRESFRNSFRKAHHVNSPEAGRAKKSRLNSTNSCLSMSMSISSG